MTALLGRKANSVTPQVYSGIQLSGSMYGNCIPLLYGMTRGSMNLLWYGDFTATAEKSGAGKGGSGPITGYNYGAAWAAALCEGPINGVAQIWHDRSIVTLVYENLELFLGEGAQPAWPIPPLAEQVPYDHIAYVATSAYNLGSSASLPNLNYEIQGLLYDTGPPGPQYGGTFTGDLTAGELAISNVSPPGALRVGSILSDSVGAIASGTTIVAIQANPASPTGFAILLSQPAAGSVAGDTIAYTVIGVSSGDADPSLVISDYLTDPNHGAGYIGGIATLSGNNAYQGYVWSLGIGLSPTETTQRQANDFLTELMQITNSEIVESAGTLKVFPYADAPVSGNGFSYDPTDGQLDPLFEFDDDDFIVSNDEDPVELTRTPLEDTYNHIIVEYLDRANYYNSAPAEAFDLDDINANGQRLAPTYTFHQITNANTAKTVAQLLLQATLFRRNSYRFKLRPDYCLLEPMDPIAITDPGLGIVGQLCWITKITDTGEDALEIEALEVTGISNTTPQYNWSAAQGYAQNFNSSPGNVEAPLIFMMPPYLASSQSQYVLGVAVCGNPDNAAWAGCNVFVSYDGDTYGFAGQLTSPCRYGTLTETLTIGSDPDTVNTLSVQMVDTDAVLEPATQAQADDMQTLILIDDAADAEVIAYSAATAVGPGEYNLGTYLRRGQYQTDIGRHVAGVPWVRLDGNIFQLPVDPGRLGDTIYLKFCSFNQSQSATQSIDQVVAYPFQLQSGALGPSLSAVTTGSCIAFDYHAAKSTSGNFAWDSVVYTTKGFQSCSATARPQTLPPLSPSANTTGPSADLGGFTADTSNLTADAGASPNIGSLGTGGITADTNETADTGAITADVATTGSFMLGLSTQPAVSSNFINANYALYVVTLNGTPSIQIVESGSVFADYGEVEIGDLLSISYDGATVRYFHNNALLREVPLVGATFYLFMPFCQPGAVASDVTFTHITPQQNNVTWITRGDNGSVAVAGNTLQSLKTNAAPGLMDAISQQNYQNGASFSCRFPVGNDAYAGLIALAGTPGTSPDNPNTPGQQRFYWHAINDAVGSAINVHEGSLDIAIGAGPVQPTDVFSITYDGYYVRYYQDGILKRTSPPVPGLTMRACFSSFEGGNIATDTYFASVPQATPWGWVATGNCVVNDENVTKIGGVNASDSGAFSITGFQAAHIFAKPNVNTDNWVMGLSTNPTASPSFTNINYGWGLGLGFWSIFESGTEVLTLSPFALATDLPTISYNGSQVVYQLNGVTIRTVTVDNLTVYGQVAVLNPGGGLNSLQFGSGSTIPTVDTSQLGNNASGQIGSAVNTGTASVSLVSGANSVNAVSITLNLTGAPVGIDVTASVEMSLEDEGFNSGTVIQVTRDGTAIGTAFFDVHAYTTNNAGFGTPLTTWQTQVTLTVDDVPSAGSHTYALQATGPQASAGGGIVIAGISLTNAAIKVREYKK
jgi:hypothetical protein